MQIILLEKVRNLGDLGSIVKVKPGYGRNYLIPYGKAVAATKKNIAELEDRRAELENKAQERLVAAQARAEKLNALEVTISAMASDEGKLYGSISNIEITRAINQQGIDVQKKEILLPEGPIHVVGEYEIGVQLHSDVVAKVKVIVVAAK